jgi:hypothetical protein
LGPGNLRCRKVPKGCGHQWQRQKGFKMTPADDSNVHRLSPSLAHDVSTRVAASIALNALKWAKSNVETAIFEQLGIGSQEHDRAAFFAEIGTWFSKAGDVEADLWSDEIYDKARILEGVINAVLQWPGDALSGR